MKRIRTGTRRIAGIFMIGLGALLLGFLSGCTGTTALDPAAGPVMIQTDDRASMLGHFAAAGYGIWHNAPMGEGEVQAMRLPCALQAIREGVDPESARFLAVMKAPYQPPESRCYALEALTEFQAKLLCRRLSMELLENRPDEREVICAPPAPKGKA